MGKVATGTWYVLPFANSGQVAPVSGNPEPVLGLRPERLSGLGLGFGRPGQIQVVLRVSTLSLALVPNAPTPEGQVTAFL